MVEQINLKPMKSKIYLYLLMLSVSLLFASCEKEYEDEARIINFPVLTLTGDEVMAITVGSQYTEPGAVATVADKAVDVTTVGSVDVNTPGVYTITYTAVNSEGYKASASRLIGVIVSDALNADLSGSYQRNGGALGTSVWTKVVPGVYKCTDVGGAKLPNDYVYVFNIDVNKVIVPTQPLGGVGSEVFCKGSNGEVIDFIPGAVGEKAYSWVVINGGYGTALRNFIRVK